MKCKCGAEWKVQENLAAYEGEVVLVCDNCRARHFNAQDEYERLALDALERVNVHIRAPL